MRRYHASYLEYSYHLNNDGALRAVAATVSPRRILLYKRRVPSLVMVVALMASAPYHTLVAQTAPSSPSPLPTVPTTHVLAIGHVTDKWTPSTRAAVMPHEVRETVRLYLGGKIGQWFVRQDQPGVVFLMNVTTVKEAKELLDALPLGVAHLMEFDLIPVGPLSPLALLLGAPVGPPKDADSSPKTRDRE